MTKDSLPVALITGAAHRIGACIARTLHRSGMNIVIHYRHSADAAESLKKELEAIRPDSVLLLQADLLDTGRLPDIIQAIRNWQGRLDLLVNNASSFYPTPLEEVAEAQWDNLIGSNMKAPFFLAKAAAPMLSECGGSIINLVDIHAQRPLKNHPVYSMAKAGNAMMVKALARELGPKIRVNGVAPGAILWPEEGLSKETQQEILSRTALERPGNPENIARTVLFLARDADYITGQVIAVDGGRTTQQ
ncbi:pteridine reductase [Candidatus Vondammii sp. HM_W22]|uniref:pteridine reductase n=1 Tax=Candidatus Vondammii sp. HM_W22 TaxID=2687299 RepID=UPI001F132513|nr:pteridine reductase [Candidatus Vondammii sp. HM_W22]